MEMTRKERKVFEGELKNFALDESPDFRANITQEMGLVRTFVTYDYAMSDLAVSLGHLDREETEVSLSFKASRMSQDGEKAAYSYELAAVTSRLVHPRRLQLPNDAYYDLAPEYGDGMYDEEDELDSQTEDSFEVLKKKVLEGLVEDGAVCEEYQQLNLAYNTIEKDIFSTLDVGTLVEGEAYHELSTSGLTYQEEDSLAKLDTLDIISELEFQSIIDGAGLRAEQYQAGGLLPAKHRMAEMLWVVRCLRAKRLLVNE